jgi:hypothetical protein
MQQPTMVGSESDIVDLAMGKLAGTFPICDKTLRESQLQPLRQPTV